MPSILCKCGSIIKYGEIPNKNELLVIPDIEYDSFSGQIDSEELYKKMKIIIKCNNCNRLFFYIDGFNNTSIIYVPDK